MIVVKKVLLIVSMLMYIAIVNITVYQAQSFDKASCEYILECEQEAEEEKKDLKEQFIDLSLFCFDLFSNQETFFSYQLKNAISSPDIPHKPPIAS